MKIELKTTKSSWREKGGAEQVKEGVEIQEKTFWMGSTWKHLSMGKTSWCHARYHAETTPPPPPYSVNTPRRFGTCLTSHLYPSNIWGREGIFGERGFIIYLRVGKKMGTGHQGDLLILGKYYQIQWEWLYLRLFWVLSVKAKYHRVNSNYI